MPRHTGLFVRLAICAGLLAYLLKKLDLGLLGRVLANTASHWPWWAAGLLFTFLGLFAGAVRWKEILRAQGLRLSMARVFRIFFIGQFFNAFMLGACGGDVARAYYASRDTPGKRAEAVSTVFVDRAVGLFAMIVFCCVMIVLRISLFLDNQGTRWPGVLMFVFLAVGLVALFALFRRNLFEHWHFFQRLEEDTRLGPLIRRAYEALYLYRAHHRVMAVSLALSVLNLALLTLACYSFGRSLEISRPLIDYFTLFPIISVLAAAPITPGGLGVREGLFVAMFQDIEVDPVRSLPLSLMVYAGSLVWSLFGGLLFVNYSSAAGHALRAELEAVKQSQSG
ncbi:MAG: lysylphosphatidylglycerol synthase transmembrane domain-containing protein [Verrucomicrobiota bacterium]